MKNEKSKDLPCPLMIQEFISSGPLNTYNEPTQNYFIFQYVSLLIQNNDYSYMYEFTNKKIKIKYTNYKYLLSTKAII